VCTTIHVRIIHRAHLHFLLGHPFCSVCCFRNHSITRVHLHRHFSVAFFELPFWILLIAFSSTHRIYFASALVITSKPCFLQTVQSNDVILNIETSIDFECISLWLIPSRSVSTNSILSHSALVVSIYI
jgi:hypothetical protein